MDNGKRKLNLFSDKCYKFCCIKSLFYMGNATLLFVVLYIIQSYNELLFHRITELISIFSSVIICMLLIISGIVMLKDRNRFSAKILRLLMFSILFQIIAELTFTTFISLYTFSILFGYYFKILSMILFCQAIVVTALASPSNLLYEKLERLNIDLEKMIGERTIELKEMNCELEEINLMLEEEIAERKKVERELRELNDGLEDKVTERTESLKKSEEQFRIMFEQAPLGIALIDSLTGQIYHVNPRFAEIAGRKVEEMTATDWMSITHPNDLKENLYNMHLLYTEKITSFTMNKRYIRPDHSIVWINITIASLRVKGSGNPCHLGMVEDITERKLIQERLQKYQSIVEKAKDVMIFLDRRGNILEVNDAAVRMYGYTFDEFLTMTIFDLRRLEKSDDIIEQMEVAYQEGIVFETIHYRKDGTFIHVEVSSQGNVLGDRKVLLSIVRDITERKKNEELLIFTIKKAEEANAAKSQFLANMSHEIRTPMNGIIGMTDLTLMMDLQAEQREYLTIIKLSTVSLLRVLNDILDYSKIEADKIDLEKKSFDLHKTIHEVMDLFNIAAKQKGLCLRLNFNKRVPHHVIGDSVRLRQVLSNLVGNGIKFTSQGEIEIQVDVKEKYYNKVTVMFVVTDTGIGIPEDKFEKLFKRFSQVDDSNTREFGGTGLGLAISKKLIELMGGVIGVESKEHMGSRFFFTAVFGLQDEGIVMHQELTQNKLIPYNNATLKKVLLVEDDLVSRNMVTIILKRNGFKVIAVENGKEAISAFEKEKIDVILMDINMPYLDGYSTTAIIRSKEKLMNCHTPIIAMTAYALQGDREKCLAAGMDDYISKPIDLSQISTKIEKHVNMENYDSSHVISNNNFAENIIDLMEASGLDKETSEGIVEDFCGQAVGLSSSIKHHIAANKLEEARIMLHQLKGSAGNVRAREIAKQALEAEQAMGMMDHCLLAIILTRIDKLIEALSKKA